MEKQINSRSGMTFVEVLISMMVMMTVMAAAVGGIAQARFMIRSAAHHAYALQVARSNLEALRFSFGYADPALSPTDVGQTHTNMPSDLPRILTIGGRDVSVDYSPSYTVTETTLAGGYSYKSVNFMVTWQEPMLTGYRQLSVAADTVISEVMDR
jgi:Tfp pilus assembly protein PilV